MRYMKRSHRTAAFMTAAVLTAAAAAVFTAVSNPLKLRYEEVSVEYGERISRDPGVYLHGDTDAYVMDRAEIIYEGRPVEGKDYDEVGDYILTIRYEDHQVEVTARVMDTEVPRFSREADEGIEVMKGEDVDYGRLIRVTDLSGATVTFDDSGVDLDEAGDYTLIATAADGEGNEISRDIQVTVTE